MEITPPFQKNKSKIITTSNNKSHQSRIFFSLRFFVKIKVVGVGTQQQASCTVFRPDKSRRRATTTCTSLRDFSFIAVSEVPFAVLLYRRCAPCYKQLLHLRRWSPLLYFCTEGGCPFHLETINGAIFRPLRFQRSPLLYFCTEGARPVTSSYSTCVGGPLCCISVQKVVAPSIWKRSISRNWLTSNHGCTCLGHLH